MPIYQKINRIMQLVHGVEKTNVNKAKGGYKFAGHEDVNAALRGHFADLGIVRSVSASDLKTSEDGTVSLLATVTYTDTEDMTQIVLTMPALQSSQAGQTSRSRFEAQQVGQCVSYATKNIEFKLFALKGDNEPDSDSTAARPRDEPSDGVPNGPEDHIDGLPGAKARAGELLTMFTKATTPAEVKEVNDIIKAEWKGSLELVPGYAEKVREVREAAYKRLKGDQP
jgi:hypothetical protein